MKALTLLKNSQTIAERAEAFATTIKRNIQRDVIDTLITKIEDIESKLFELKDFNLQTNVNLGLKAATREDIEKRFKEIIDLEYQLTILKLEHKVKSASFETYFGENQKEEVKSTEYEKS